MFRSAGMATPQSNTSSKVCVTPSSRMRADDLLWDALKQASVEKVQEALRREPDDARIPFFDHRWEPPLCAAVRFQCSTNIIKELLDHKSDPNMCDAEGQSPLVILYKQTQKNDRPCWPVSNHAANAVDQVAPMLFSMAEKPQWSLGSHPVFPDSPKWPCFREVEWSQAGKNVWESYIVSFGTIGQVQEAETLRKAGLLLKHAAGPQSLKSVMQRIATWPHGTCEGTEVKLRRLLEDWPEATAFGLSLCAIRRDGGSSSNFAKNHAFIEHWELLLNYVICLDIFNAAALRFVRA